MKVGLSRTAALYTEAKKDSRGKWNTYVGLLYGAVYFHSKASWRCLGFIFSCSWLFLSFYISFHTYL